MAVPNLSSILGGACALACFAPLTFAQDPTREPGSPRDSTRIVPQSPTGIARTLRASEILGREVQNAKGEDLGEIEDIVLDEGEGRIAYAVLSFGGFLGMGDRLFAIPYTALRPADEDTFVLDVSKEVLEKAPGFDKDNWPDTADRQWGESIHRHYSQKPYWEHDGAGATALARPIDVRQAQSFEGTVESTSCGHKDGECCKDPSKAVTVQLKTADDREVMVHLAPHAFLKQQSIKLAEDDKIVVKGVPSSEMGRDPVVATEIRRGDTVISLRNADGTPAWSQADSKQPGSQGKKTGSG
jgi:sporulation protein YlmC with PRC-barrel domain